MQWICNYRDGSKTELLGYVDISLYYGNHTFKVECAVINNLPCQIIFGMDQLKRRDAMINLKNDEVWLLDDSSKQVKISASATKQAQSEVLSKEYEVRCRDDVTIPPNCTVLTCTSLRLWDGNDVVVPDLFGTELIVEMGDKSKLRLPEGLWIAWSLVCPDEMGHVQVAILNPTNDIIAL